MAPPHNPGTILLAEDDDQLRELFKCVLESAGYSLHIAKDAVEALRVARQADDIQLLIANVQMPGMLGPDLARELRRTHPNLRVVLISGFPQGPLVLEAGWQFIKKPFLPSAIVEKVNEALRLPPKPQTDVA